MSVVGRGLDCEPSEISAGGVDRSLAQLVRLARNNDPLFPAAEPDGNHAHLQVVLAV